MCYLSSKLSWKEFSEIVYTFLKIFILFAGFMHLYYPNFTVYDIVLYSCYWNYMKYIFFYFSHFRRPLNIICEFIPQVIFLMSLFGYLVIMIFFKWIKYNVHKANCAPSLLISLINMFLMKYTDEPCYLAPMYHGQVSTYLYFII